MANSTENNKSIVGIRFSPIGKSYNFDASSLDSVELEEYVVVETSRGWQLGKIVQILKKENIKENIRYKPINRIATPDDLKKKNYLDGKAAEVLLNARKAAKSNKIEDIKIVSAEFSFDEKVLSFLYTTEKETQTNFKKLIHNIKDRYKVKKVDFHKVGPRDIAKYYGGMGACGMETRCCTKFLCKFESISIRMAKTQGISLTPSDITGMCNRLRCCLGYEYCIYVDALKGFPKKNKFVKTPLGKGKVRDIAPLKKTVFVNIENHGTKEFTIDEIEIIQPEEAKKDPSNQKGRQKTIKTQKNKRPNRRRRRPNPKTNNKKQQ